MKKKDIINFKVILTKMNGNKFPGNTTLKCFVLNLYVNKLFFYYKDIHNKFVVQNKSLLRTFYSITTL